MLIRFLVDNLLSFGTFTEFNLLTSSQTSKKKHHLYNCNGSEFLKMSAIYGANGAGKSNLIYSIIMLSSLIEDEDYIGHILFNRFKASKNDQRQDVLLGAEFINKNTPYLYAVKIGKGKIIHEELYKSGLGTKPNELIFERTLNDKGDNQLTFPDSFYENEEGKVLNDVILKSFKSSKKVFLKILSELEHESFSEIKNAYDWFNKKLVPLTPGALYGSMISRFVDDSKFSTFAKKMICSFHTGIREMHYEKKELSSYLGDNDDDLYEDIYQDLLKSDGEFVDAILKNERIAFKLENDIAFVYRVYFHHVGINDDVKFYLDDESDGTKKLFDYIPIFKEIVEDDRVYILDEIERSIHPTIIKELIAKFSVETKTKGQLIFSTHESNLLDQEIFRQDEIWFVEKDENACSKLYPLSDFKVHHTKNIEKGYLNGRYGGIPFTGNLKDLNWTLDEITEPA